MSPQKWESRSYVWFEDDRLGDGATAAVYKCRKKESGDIYAVKVLNDPRAKMKDLESSILGRLKHENVVSLLAVEKCEALRAEVIIMEYCNEGSLHSFLLKPENAFGLCESDLLAVLRDLVSAMQYVRSEKISHRDIKPLNILRSIRNDGTAVHKLADFGCSFVVKDEDNFASVVGTEEYMHPDIFSTNRAGLSRHTEKKFKTTADLWSFGVTMYQCITGKLPFSAYERRGDKATMSRIHSERSPNDISGIQKVKNGDIEWSSSYPESCRIPRELMQLFLPIQRGVFDTAKDTSWTFDFFFDKINDVLTRKKIQAVDVFGTDLHCLYLPEDCRLAEIQNAVSEATGIESSDLLLLCNNAELDAYGTSVSFGDQSSLQSNASVGHGVTTGGPVYAFSKSKGGSSKPNSTVLLKVDLEAGMDSTAAIAAAQRLLFAAQDASDRLDLINKGMLALLGHQRQSLMRRKAVLERSPFAGASGKHRVQALSQLSSTTKQFQDLLEHFTSTLFSNAPIELPNKGKSLKDAIMQWEGHRTQVIECVKSHDLVVQERGERPEDEQIAQQWKRESSDVNMFRNHVSRIHRLCQDLIQQESQINSKRNAEKYVYAIKLFEGDIRRIQELYTDCQSTIKHFEECLNAWIKDGHLSYTAQWEQKIQEYERLAASQEQLMKDYDVVTKEKDELIRGILSLVIEVQGTSKDSSYRNSVSRTTESHHSSAAGAATVRATETYGGATADATFLDEALSVRLAPRTQLSQMSASAFSSGSLHRLQMLANRLQQETEAVVEENKRLLNGM